MSSRVDRAWRTGPVNGSAEVVINAAPQRVWDAVVDWPRHGKWVPLTVVRTSTASPSGVGARFVARTALGPLGFDDVMEVTLWRPPQGVHPGRVEVLKQGRVLTGMAWFEVAALAGARPVRSRLTWYEEVGLAGRGLPLPLAAALRAPVSFGLGRVLRAAARDVEGEGEGGGEAIAGVAGR